MRDSVDGDDFKTTRLVVDRDLACCVVHAGFAAGSNLGARARDD